MAVEYKAAPNKQSGFEAHRHMVNSLFWNLLLLKILSDIQERITSWKPNFNSNFGKSGCLQRVTSERQVPHKATQGHPPKPSCTNTFSYLNSHISYLFILPCSSPYTAKHREPARLKINLLHPFWWQCQLDMFLESKCWTLTSTDLLLQLY